MISVEEAQQRIIHNVTPLPEEQLPLNQTLERVLTKSVHACRANPPAAVSAMDGYALRAKDASGPLRIVGLSAAGAPYLSLLKQGECVRIYTGAHVPEGADSILIQENALVEKHSLSPQSVPKIGDHIRKKGLDYAEGDVLIEKGTCLGARDLGLAASTGLDMLTVRSMPRVILLSTGSELVIPGSREKLTAAQIYESNMSMIGPLVAGFGGKVIQVQCIPDDLPKTVDAIRQALESQVDVIVTIGGASVGDHDLIRAGLEACAVKPDFWKVAMRPGKPVFAARDGQSHILGLPGNPVSAYVCAMVFLRPLLMALLGARDVFPVVRHARLAQTVAANGERQAYLRATIVEGSDGPEVKTLPHQDSALLKPLAQASALLIRSPHAPLAEAGSWQPVILL